MNSSTFSYWKITISFSTTSFKNCLIGPSSSIGPWYYLWISMPSINTIKAGYPCTWRRFFIFGFFSPSIWAKWMFSFWNSYATLMKLFSRVLQCPHQVAYTFKKTIDFSLMKFSHVSSVKSIMLWDDTMAKRNKNLFIINSMRCQIV